MMAQLPFLITTALSVPREQTTFDYGWRFQLGEPATAVPPLTTASLDPSFTIVTNNSTCSQVSSNVTFFAVV
jgi:hypothetical protein